MGYFWTLVTVNFWASLIVLLLLFCLFRKGR